MKQEILDRIDSVVAGYVNQYATDWTEIDRPLVEKLHDSNSFLVMMRPSGVDVAFFGGESASLENVFHSQAAVPNHELFLFYDGEKMQSITRVAAQKLCDKFATRFQDLDLPMDGFRKAVERCSDEAARNENNPTAVGECGPWKVSLLDRQYTTGAGLEVCYENKPVAKAYKTVDHWGGLNLEFGRIGDAISDKTFNEIFDCLRSEFPTLTRDFNERKKFQAASNDFSK